MHCHKCMDILLHAIHLSASPDGDGYGHRASSSRAYQSRGNFGSLIYLRFMVAPATWGWHLNANRDSDFRTYWASIRLLLIIAGTIKTTVHQCHQTRISDHRGTIMAYNQPSTWFETRDGASGAIGFEAMSSGPVSATISRVLMTQLAVITDRIKKNQDKSSILKPASVML